MNYLEIKPEVREALANGKAVVALESTIIAHGMPYPKNVETALAVEDVIRKNGAVPATIAIIDGVIKVGLTPEEIEYLGTAKGVMKVFGETECKIIGSRHGEKLYETLVTREEMLRSVDMGHYYRIMPDARGLNYDKFYVQGTVHTEGDEAYTSHNTNRLDVDGVVKKIMGTDYVKEELEGRPHAVEA